MAGRFLEVRIDDMSFHVDMTMTPSLMIRPAEEEGHFDIGIILNNEVEAFQVKEQDMRRIRKMFVDSRLPENFLIEEVVAQKI